MPDECPINHNKAVDRFPYPSKGFILFFKRKQKNKTTLPLEPSGDSFSRSIQILWFTSGLVMTESLTNCPIRTVKSHNLTSSIKFWES